MIGISPEWSQKGLLLLSSHHTEVFVLLNLCVFLCVCACVVWLCMCCVCVCVFGVCVCVCVCCLLESIMHGRVGSRGQHRSGCQWRGTSKSSFVLCQIRTVLCVHECVLSLFKYTPSKHFCHLHSKISVHHAVTTAPCPWKGKGSMMPKQTFSFHQVRGQRCLNLAYRHTVLAHAPTGCI